MTDLNSTSTNVVVGAGQTLNILSREALRSTSPITGPSMGSVSLIQAVRSRGSTISRSCKRAERMPSSFSPAWRRL